jgi:Protein of unknown function (DUF4240)
MPHSIPMMAPKVFWDLIEAARNPDQDRFLQALRDELVRLPLDDIVGFDTRLWHYLGLANRRDLWNAACFLTLCPSDDSFRYFGCWLIAQGKQAFDNALADPDSLATLPAAERYDLELIMDSALEAWEAKTGQDGSAFDAAKENAEKDPWPGLVAQDWDVNDEAELRKHFPRLLARHAQE